MQVPSVESSFFFLCQNATIGAGNRAAGLIVEVDDVVRGFRPAPVGAFLLQLLLAVLQLVLNLEKIENL